MIQEENRPVCPSHQDLHMACIHGGEPGQRSFDGLCAFFREIEMDVPVRIAIAALSHGVEVYSCWKCGHCEIVVFHPDPIGWHCRSGFPIVLRTILVLQEKLRTSTEFFFRLGSRGGKRAAAWFACAYLCESVTHLMLCAEFLRFFLLYGTPFGKFLSSLRDGLRKILLRVL